MVETKRGAAWPLFLISFLVLFLALLLIRQLVQMWVEVEFFLQFPGVAVFGRDGPGMVGSAD